MHEVLEIIAHLQEKLYYVHNFVEPTDLYDRLRNRSLKGIGMSATNPIVTVYYPPLSWLKWLPRIFWKAKHDVKLVRVAPSGSEFFDPHGFWIEMHFRGGDPVYYLQR